MAGAKGSKSQTIYATDSYVVSLAMRCLEIDDLRKYSWEGTAAIVSFPGLQVMG